MFKYNISLKNVIKKNLPISLKNKISYLILKRKQYRRKNAQKWYGKTAIDTSTAIEKITGNNGQVSFFEIHENLYSLAKQKADSCTVKMGGPGNLELIYQLSEYIKANKVVETGVAYGWSSLAFLASIHGREDALLVSTDRPYPGRDNKDYVGVVVPEDYKKNWKLLFGLDANVLPDAISINKEIDICHYDSDKRYRGRMRAYTLLWEALRPGGIFISDDIGDNFAFRDFAKNISIEPIVVEKHTPHIEGRYVGVLIKPKESN